MELEEWFGYWPSFHDAEIVGLHLNRKGSSSLRVHTWEMTNNVNAQGFYELIKHIVVEVALEGISNVNLGDLAEHSILLDLGAEKTERGFRLDFSAAYGLFGTIEAQRLSLHLKPGKPFPHTAVPS